MEEYVIDTTLRKVAKGASIFLFGTVFSLFLGLITKIIVVRYLSKPDYGVLTLALTIFGIVQAVASFGIPMAMVRQASYYSGKGDDERAKATMRLALYLIVILGVVWSLLLLFLSGFLAKTFKMPQLKWVLDIISICVPFALLNSYLVSFYQTLENAKVKVLFNDFLVNFLRLLAIVVVILIGLSFYGVVLAYTLTPIFVFILFFSYFFLKGDIQRIKLGASCLKFVTELLTFSAPLALQSILGMIVTWTDVLMLGYLLTARDVAIYGAAKPIANTLTVVLSAANFLYFPLVSQMFGKCRMMEIRRTYAIITKWATAVTLPVFLVIFLFSRDVVWVLYGTKYLDASVVLSILALAFFVHISFGPNGFTLVIFGENKFVTIVTAIAAFTNIVLNMMLIPQLGVIGAAVATLITYTFSNVACGTKLLVEYGIHPFTKNYLKPIFVCFAVAITINKCFNKVDLFGLFLLFTLFLIIYFVALIITRSFEKEDVMMLSSIEQKTGMNLEPIKRILRRFL